jgi:hypothetical protein
MGRVDDLEDEADLVPSDEEDEDLAPLVKRPNANESSQRLQSFEIVTSSRKKRQPSRLRKFSWIALQIFIVALTLRCAAKIYFLSFQSERPSDLINTCDSRHIEKLMEQIEETSDFCDPDVSDSDRQLLLPKKPMLNSLFQSSVNRDLYVPESSRTSASKPDELEFYF